MHVEEVVTKMKKKSLGRNCLLHAIRSIIVISKAGTQSPLFSPLRSLSSANPLVRLFRTSVARPSKILAIILAVAVRLNCGEAEE